MPGAATCHELPASHELCLLELPAIAATNQPSLLDLAVVADDTMIGAVMNFAEKVASVYDVSDLTLIEVDKLAAETGPGTMPASQLLALVLEVSKVIGNRTATVAGCHAYTLTASK